MQTTTRFIAAPIRCVRTHIYDVNQAHRTASRIASPSRTKSGIEMSIMGFLLFSRTARYAHEPSPTTSLLPCAAGGWLAPRPAAILPDGTLGTTAAYRGRARLQ